MINLRILRWGDYPQLSSWALTMITNAPIREAEGDWTRRKGENGVNTVQRFGDAGPRHWHDMVTSQGTLARYRKRRDRKEKR